jgi:hypothetical protein
MATDRTPPATHVDPDAIAPAPSHEPASHIEHRKRDKAAGFLATVTEDVSSFSYEEEKSVLRKIDRRVLPIILIACKL